MGANAIVYRIFVNIIGIGLSGILFKHVVVSSFLALVLSGIVLSVLNLFLKPILFLATLPLQILSFGIFYLITNAIILKLTSAFIDGFYIDGFWAAIGASILIGLVNIIFDLLATNDELRYYRWK
ncbi:phage holin family protein [Deferribacterales bacterium Es71-Z0220]|uniref:phage holin family protein n=1 Tax=Deferrivibrio essentukiensis TaxID=2880922 RepID=UPI001F60B6DE|nr:phage holin family protein [Deferrivibrio essentukiensis]MCB4204288.1 phage holin family protein [Deferrivibrio essentukiensis]